MKPTPIHPKGWTDKDAKLVADYVAEVKRDDEKRKKREWGEKKELEAGRHLRSLYEKGMNSPRDVPAMRKQASWLEEQNQQWRPFGYYERRRRKENLFILFVAIVVALSFLKLLTVLGLVIS